MEYTVIRKKRKTLGIKISEAGDVLVYAPFKVNLKTIDSIVKSKEHWILESKKKVFKYDSGDRLHFLGKEYILNIIKGTGNDINIELEGSKFNVYFCGENLVSVYDQLSEYLYRRYKKVFFHVVKERITLMAARIGVRPNNINIKNQKTIWGSCSHVNNISINFRLSMAPLEVLDYVILHELCHIIHKNHSQEFWLTLEGYMPDYKIKRNWLKANSHKPLF